ncbi:hypothetical protein BDW71DRAFT_194068 [Aspergillus fruticulosus]
MPITKTMVQRAERELAAAKAQAAAQKVNPSKKRQREADNSDEREEEESARKPTRETRSQTRKRQLQGSETGRSGQEMPTKRRRTAQRSKASPRRTDPSSSGPITRFNGSLSDAKPKPSKATPSTSRRATRSTTRNQGECIQTECIEAPGSNDKGKAPVYSLGYYESRPRSRGSQPTSVAPSQQPVRGYFDISAATSQAASLLPQFYGQGTPATSSDEPPVTRSSTRISTEFETGTSNATTSAVTDGSQYEPGSDSDSSEAIPTQPSAASDATVKPATHSRKRKTTYKDRATLQKEAQKKAKDELKANTGYGVGTKTSAFLHWIPIPSDREYLQRIESVLWRRNSMKKERGKGRGYRDAWWWHFADHYKVQADGVSCELDYSELMRASAEASVFSDKPGLKKMTTPICDRCFFLGRACKTDQVNACISCIRAFQPCTMTERKYPFTRRQFTGQRWINHGFDIKFNIIKKPTEDPHRLFCDWEGLPLPPPPKAGELVYLRGKSLERPNAHQPKAVPRLPFNRAYQVPDRIYEKYNLHEVNWPCPLPDPFPVGDEKPTDETSEQHERRLATKHEVEVKRVEYNRRQQERRQQAENGELPATRSQRVYPIEWQKARQKKMMADYHQRTRHRKTSKGSTRGRSRAQSRATSSMAEVEPNGHLEQQAEQQLQSGLQQHLQQQGPPQSQEEAPVQHANDIEMGYPTSQPTTDHGNEDAIMADASNAISSHSGIPIDPALERMQFYRPLSPAQLPNNTTSEAGLHTTTYESTPAVGNTESQIPAQNGRRTRARTKTVGGKKQKSKESIKKKEPTDEPKIEASQLGPITVTGSRYQILQGAGAVPNEPPATSTPNNPSTAAQASWDNPYPDPPAQDTDTFGYYAIAGVEATPEDLFGCPVTPHRPTYRPPHEAHNEWYIPNPYASTVPPGPAHAYPTFSAQNAQRHNKEENQGGSEDVEMGGV